jgi:hypothetical protein
MAESKGSSAQTISLVCPNCMKEVTIRSSLGPSQWREEPRHSTECPFIFHVQMYMPKAFEGVAMGHPLIFIMFSSKRGMTDLVETIMACTKWKEDERERKKWTELADNLKKLLPSDLDAVLEKGLDAVETGLFGLRVYIGDRRIEGTRSAYLWKWEKRYFGVIYPESLPVFVGVEDDVGMEYYDYHINSSSILASDSFSDAKEFMHRLFHYEKNSA